MAGSAATGLGCHDARQIKLGQLRFRINERFLYEYDFGDLWQHQVRIEKRLEIETSRSYPVCVGGQWAGPPEDCGGPRAFLERRATAPWRVRELLDNLLEDIETGDTAHGNVGRALDTIDDIEDELDLLSQDGESRKKLLKAVREFRGYIEANQNFIPNYGDRYRHGEKISTAFAESAVNQVVSKRMVKKQQMRWTESGAHNLLQVRTKVLNDQLRESFVRWYPGMQTEHETEIQKKAA